MRVLRPRLTKAVDHAPVPPPSAYMQSLKIALNERLSKRDRQNQIRDIMRAEFSAPLARELNNRVDVSLVPEEMEGTILKVVSDEVIEEFVKVIVGEIDEALEGSD